MQSAEAICSSDLAAGFANVLIAMHRAKQVDLRRALLQALVAPLAVPATWP